MSDLIIPPKKIIKVINATVASIAKWGDSLEKRLMEEQKNTAKFSFLQPNDPFYPFYQLKLEEAKSGIKKEETNSSSSLSSSTISTTTTATNQSTAPKPIPTIVPPSFSYKHPPDIGGLQLDVIHLVAQNTALYGREFLQAIAKQEMDSPLFNFLKPDQPYFRLFTGLLDQYRLAIDPSNQLKRRLEQESASLQNVKLNLEMESEHAKMIQEQKKKEAAEAKKDESLDQYDWTSFHVVGTVNYDDDDEIERQNQIKNEQQQQQQQPTKMIPTTLKRQRKGITQISPITGQQVPIEEFGDHLRYEKVHPQYQKELDTMKERKANQNSALATGDQMAENLKNFASGEAEPKKNLVMWDGRQETIQMTVAEAVDNVMDMDKQERQNGMKKKPPIIGPRFDRKPNNKKK